MPPDRTSYSPVPSTSQQRDKAASIARGLACLACRKRKVKCDSMKPICTGCYKHAKGDNSTISCVYDDMNAPKKKRSSPGTLAALEATNQALRDELAELKDYMTQMRTSTSNLPLPPSHNTPSSSVEGSSYRLQFAPPPPPPMNPAGDYGSSSYAQAPAVVTVCEPQDPRGSAYSASLDYTLSKPEGSGGGGGNVNYLNTSNNASQPTPPESPPSDFWNQLMYPGWPRDLPSFDLTSRLIDVWFSKPHCLTGLINEAQFRSSMLHPPSTSSFPHSALIHAMMAIASMLVSEEFFMNEPRYWPTGQKVSEYHAARGKVALDQAIAHGQRLLQVSQAVTILCYWAYTAARFVELWLLCGMATRIMTPLGLNQLAAPSSGVTYKMHLLPPPKDDSELYERSINCWYAFMSDRMATACTGWAHSLDEADVVSLLPTDAPSTLAGDWDSSPLSPKSPSFFLAHPPHLVGPKQLELKAIILLGRVNTFVQRAPLASKRDQNGPYASDSDVRKSDAFRKLENDIIGFQASIPREYQSTCATTVDPRLHIVHSLPPASMILLHERFVTAQADDSSAPLTLRYAQQVMQVLHSVVSTSFEIGLLSPFMNYVWVVAGRNIVREIAFRMIRNQPAGIDQLRGDVQTILLALHACKTPLASSTAQQLQTLLDDPYRALPNSIQLNNCPDTSNVNPQAMPGGGGQPFNDFDALLRSNFPNYPIEADYATPSSSSYHLFTPPLSTPSAHGSLPTGGAQPRNPISSSNATSAPSEKTYREIDETLARNGFFGTLGDNSFGPELDALIHGSRASAPWILGGNVTAVSQTHNPNVSNMSNVRGENAMRGAGGGGARFEEVEIFGNQ
ncbi:Zn(II)2Cys6 transcription factor [Sporobolomyces salmoneus]|uniref:Zn(II)2Cys6 transcription factor n=1 Tax=Sporobolomyces salmoneus TaxID=183962 RepID=UPI00316E1734